jgi:hypothetical protein
MRIYELRLEHIGLRLRELRTKDAIPVHNASLKVPGLLKPAARFVDLQLQVCFLFCLAVSISISMSVCLSQAPIQIRPLPYPYTFVVFSCDNLFPTFSLSLYLSLSPAGAVEHVQQLFRGGARGDRQTQAEVLRNERSEIPWYSTDG